MGGVMKDRALNARSAAGVMCRPRADPAIIAHSITLLYIEPKHRGVYQDEEVTQYRQGPGVSPTYKEKGAIDNHQYVPLSQLTLLLRTRAIGQDRANYCARCRSINVLHAGIAEAGR